MGVAFVLFGAFVGVWAVAAADVERELGVSHGRFGLLLTVALAMAGVANIMVGPIVDRFGTRRVLVVALALWTVAMLSVPLVPSRLLVVSIAAGFGFGGAVDVTMNVAAASRLAGRPGSLVRFHGLFNLGAAIGAVVTGVVIRSGGSWRLLWAGVGAAAGLLAVVVFAAARGAPVLPSWIGSVPSPLGRAERWRPGAAIRLLRAPALAAVAAAFCGAALVEGGIDTWGVLFLRERVGTGVVVGSLAASAGFLVAGLARLVLGPRIGDRGARRGVVAGSLLASLGLVAMALSPTGAAASVSLVVAAAGVSMCWPLLLAIATRMSDDQGAVVGAVSGVGYLGFIVGPSVVGAVSDAAGLRFGVLTVAAVACLVAGIATLSRRRWDSAVQPR